MSFGSFSKRVSFEEGISVFVWLVSDLFKKKELHKLLTFFFTFLIKAALIFKVNCAEKRSLVQNIISSLGRGISELQFELQFLLENEIFNSQSELQALKLKKVTYMSHFPVLNQATLPYFARNFFKWDHATSVRLFSSFNSSVFRKKNILCVKISF